MIAIGPNFFYTVTLPVTLWFLDRGKRGTPREDTVLFLDARHTYRQIDRAHRDFLPEQIELLANIVRLYRGEEPETVAGSEELHRRALPRRRLRRRAGPLQGRDARRDRGAGLEPQPRPLRRRRRRRRGRRRLRASGSRSCTTSSRVLSRRGRGAATRRSTPPCRGSSRRERVARGHARRRLIDVQARVRVQGRALRGSGGVARSSRRATSSIGRRLQIRAGKERTTDGRDSSSLARRQATRRRDD